MSEGLYMTDFSSRVLNKVRDNMESKYGNRGFTALKYYRKDPDTIPIYKRTSISPIRQANLVNAHADFMSSIVNQKVGYLGTLNVVFNNEMLNPSLSNRVNDWWDYVKISNQFELKNPETVRWTTIEGISHRLIYLKEGEIRFKNLHSWQVAYEYDDNIFDATRAFVYFEKTDLEGKTTEYCHVYDDEMVSYYTKYNNGWISYTPEGATGSTEEHMIGMLPLVPFLNNEFMVGDCNPNVLRNINIYDEVQSDVLSEIKAFRNALLKIFGDVVPEGIEPADLPVYITETGAFMIKTDDEGKPLGDVEFLQKVVDDAMIEHNLDRMRDQIFSDAQAVDEKSITLGANTRVIAIKAMFDKLERKVETFIKYYNSSIRRQFEIIFSLSEKGFLSDFVINEQEKWQLLTALDITYDHKELTDPMDVARMHEINIKTMSLEDAFSLHPDANHDPIGFAERYRQQIDSETIGINQLGIE